MMERDRRLTGSLRGQSVSPPPARPRLPLLGLPLGGNADLPCVGFTDGADRAESVRNELNLADREGPAYFHLDHDGEEGCISFRSVLCIHSGRPAQAERAGQF